MAQSRRPAPAGVPPVGRTVGPTLKTMSTRPSWLKVRLPGGDNYAEVRRILRAHKLNTICEDALCPNIAECWGKHRTATFMILGDICTRACAFCAVTSGRPTEYDLMEPERVAAAIADLRLKHAVITSVDRDDLADGGASIFAETVRQIRAGDSHVKVELLTPDFQGSVRAVRTIIEAGPELKIVAVNKLDEEMCWASPAVAGNHVLIRTIDHLYAIGEK